MELINSKYTRDRYAELGFELTDWNKATLIWNNPSAVLCEKIEELKVLANETAENDLKEQIEERIAYQEKVINSFKNDDDKLYVYVVKDSEESCDWGYFSLYEGALKQATKLAMEENIDMDIYKQLIITEIEPITLMDYVGMEIASIRVNKAGEIVAIWSEEISHENPMKEWDNQRFENRFFTVPYVHGKGLPVKDVITGDYGILETSKEEWDNFISKVENGLYVDFTDIAHTVYSLSTDGCWSHGHWNPMYMEVSMPEGDYSNKKERAMIRAFEAFSDYLSGYTSEANEKLVLSTTRDYAKACNEVRKAKSIEDILR